MTEITLNQTRELVTVLTGGLIDEVTFHHPPMTTRQAFSVIYHMQERLRIFPTHFELCEECEELFDSRYDGGTRKSDNAQICDGCKSDYSFCCECCDLVPLGTVDDNGECEECRGTTATATALESEGR